MDHGGHDSRALVRFGWLMVIVWVAVLIFSFRARADYDGPVSPEIQQWFRTVKNADGQYCCDGTEVAHVSDYQWRGDHFDVIVDGATYHVKPQAVSPERNRLGDALVWFYPRGATRTDDTLRCFLRGTEG